MLWVVDKTDIESGASSIVKALKIGEASSTYIQTIYHIKEHSFFGLMVSGLTADVDYATNSEVGYIIDWNVGSNAFYNLELSGSYLINHFATMAVGGDWGILHSGLVASGSNSYTWVDSANPVLTYGVVSGSVARSVSGLMTQSWAREILASLTYCAGVEAMGSSFLALFMFYDGPHEGMLLLTTIDSAGSNLNWHVLDLGVVTDADDIAIWSVAA